DAPVGMGAGQNVPDAAASTPPAGGASTGGTDAGADPTGVVPGGTPIDDPAHGLDGGEEVPLMEGTTSPDAPGDDAPADGAPADDPGFSAGTPGAPAEGDDASVLGGDNNLVTGRTPSAGPLAGGPGIDLSQYDR